MKSFHPFSHTNKFTLFEIRLDSDFLVFRGSEHDASGQLLKGTVVLCLSEPLKVEDIHLRLTGEVRQCWEDSRLTSTGLINQKVDKKDVFKKEYWPSFVGERASDSLGAFHSHSKAVTLPAGNYEWPFELMLPGDTPESIEGMKEAQRTYKLKATIVRPLLSRKLHAYKHLRVVRTLDTQTLEASHSMEVKNTWVNKIDYHISIPNKAVVFGTSIPLETRISPLLKGLEVAEINVKLVEIHEVVYEATERDLRKQLKREREVDAWAFPITREEYWRDINEDPGQEFSQEGWVMNTSLALPKKLRRCVQSVSSEHIKVKHKVKITVSMKNPDGHVSELRASLPLTIFISPNMPFDDAGNLVQLPAQGSGADLAGTAAPPSYSEHILDQLYDELELTGMQTPTSAFGASRSVSAENLADMAHSGVPPAALALRLQSVSLKESHRNTSWNSMSSAASRSTGGRSGDSMTPHTQGDTVPSSAASSAPLTRHNSAGSPSVEETDWIEMSRVPSYQTAVRAPIRPLTTMSGVALPDYQTAMRASRPYEHTLHHR